ncbi:DUF2970 domain-containing protein [Gammaproteobacteria bacterium]|nr:DUF2970 domain-containing protein [Gammaproteobacteria bacterium]
MANTDGSDGDNADEQARDLSFWELLKSTSAAFIGVQSNANRERDFRRGKISHFIWMGLLFGLLFVGTLVGVVQLVLHFTGN